MPLKARDLRELDVDDLQTRSKELRARLFDLRSRQARKELEGGIEIRTVRRDLARVNSVLNERLRASKAAGSTEKNQS